MTGRPRTVPDEWSSWRVRMELAKLGWTSKTRLASPRSDGGRHEFRIWYKRWDWHGRRSEVLIHDGVHLRTADRAAASAAMAELVRLVGQRCLGAWDDYVDCVPCQVLEGKLAVHDRETEYFRRAQPLEPTERLPEDMAAACDAAGDPVLASALDLAGLGMDYEDEFTHLWRTPGDWPLERRWGLDYDVVPRRWNGAAVAHHRLTFAVDSPNETMVGLALQGTCHAVRSMLDRYRPGGPLGDLPPGMKTVEQHWADEEEKGRARDVACLAEHGGWEESDVEELLALWTMRRESNQILARHLPPPTREDVVAKLGAATAGGQRFRA